MKCSMIVWTVSLDEDPLMATFAVFMHTMLSAALDTSFLASIVQNEEGTISFLVAHQLLLNNSHYNDW